MATQTLLEFVRPVLNGSRRDLCLAAMYYLRAEHGAEQCTASELKAALLAARIPKAKTFNVADVLGKAGDLVSTHQQNASKANLWHLTESGDRQVREKLGIVADRAEIEIKNDISVMNALVASEQRLGAELPRGVRAGIRRGRAAGFGGVLVVRSHPASAR
jgi:hypothetical protein